MMGAGYATACNPWACIVSRKCPACLHVRRRPITGTHHHCHHHHYLYKHCSNWIRLSTTFINLRHWLPEPYMHSAFSYCHSPAMQVCGGSVLPSFMGNRGMGRRLTYMPCGRAQPSLSQPLVGFNERSALTMSCIGPWEMICSHRRS